MSQWIEVSIQTTHEAADLVAEIMRAAGANNGVVIEDPVLINTLRNSGTWELCDIPAQEYRIIPKYLNYAIFLSRKTQKWLR